jgi:2-dehydro-3-deoxygluconokinase
MIGQAPLDTGVILLQSHYQRQLGDAGGGVLMAEKPQRAAAAGRPRVICIGECMVEVNFAAAGPRFAGDTFNTAIYLSRLGAEVSYATVLGGEDAYTLGMLAMMGDEGVDASLVARAPGRLPGLYVIRTDGRGERSFHYWRGQAPVRDFARLMDLAALRAAIGSADLVYVSGVTLAVIGAAGRAVLVPLLGGCDVAFDLNYRPRLWESLEEARAAATEIASLSRFISVGLDEAEALFGGGPLLSQDAGREAREIVARSSDGAVTLLLDGECAQFPGEAYISAVDTTGAGDSFNAGYLHARLTGAPPAEALLRGRDLAREVVRHLGAIVPRTATPERSDA